MSANSDHAVDYHPFWVNFFSRMKLFNVSISWGLEFKRSGSYQMREKGPGGEGWWWHMARIFFCVYIGIFYFSVLCFFE